MGNRSVSVPGRKKPVIERTYPVENCGRNSGHMRGMKLLADAEFARSTENWSSAAGRKIKTRLRKFYPAPHGPSHYGDRRTPGVQLKMELPVKQC